MPCKHYKEMMIYAQQAAECDEPWKLWEWRIHILDGWKPCTEHPDWHHSMEYRQIPKTIRIGNLDVPEPMRGKPEHHSKYYFVSTHAANGVEEKYWHDCKLDNRFLRLGVCHATEEAAIAHAKALFSFGEIKP